MAQQIEFRRDTAAQWTSANPVLAQGEPALETDTKKLKIGDGTTAWASLAYVATQIALGLTPTTVKTAGYTAVAGDFVPVDTTSGAVTVTFPTAPPDGTVIAVKHVIQGGSNTVTLALGGSDKFNATSGTTTRTLTILSQALLAQYKASSLIWYVVSDDLPLSGLDTRYRLALTLITSADITDGTIAVADMSTQALASRNLYLAANYQ